MKSEWKVRELYRRGWGRMHSYQVYRLMNASEPDKMFNREFLLMEYRTRKEAEAMAAKLNTEEKSK